MATYNVVFYDVDPQGMFSMGAGGTGTYTGPASADGTAAITDNEAGIEGQTLDDDLGGGETATADVTIGGLTSTASDVEAQMSWTLRDTVTGEVFEVVQFDVASGAAAGEYTLSERPLVVGRTYETIEFAFGPNVHDGDPVFTYSEQSGFTADPVDGTSGDDSISASSGYTDGDGDGVTSGDDTVLAGDGNDSIDAGAGDDSIEAGDGNDFIYGSDGADTIDGGGWYDIVTYEHSGSGVTVDLSDASAETGGQAEGDVLLNIEQITGSAYADHITADDSGLTASGEHGHDTLVGGDGDDRFWGGHDNDLIMGYGGDDSLQGEEGADTLSGHQGDDTLSGGSGSDNLTGGEGNDSISGGSDADVIRGDNLWFDPADFASGSSGSATNLTVTNSAEGPVDLWYIDPSGTLIHYATINAGQTHVQSTFDDHNWVLRAPDGYYLRIIEGASNQTVDYGGAGLDDTIDGGGGADTIYGEFGADSITGGGGHDEIYGGYGDDCIDGGAGNDTIQGGAGSDTLLGGTGADSLAGGDDADLFVIEDGFGADTVEGGSGGTDDDALDVSALTGSVTVSYTGSESGTLTDGADTLSFSDFERLTLTDGADVVLGSADGSGLNVDAGGGADTITGGSGADTLDGGSGDDAITGGTGDDSLSGGSGDDTFFYSIGDGADTIADFNTGTGTISDGDSTNNDFINLSGFYDNLSELYADQADDGVLNQSNATDTKGRSVNYADNSSFGPGSLTFTGASADNSSFTAENTAVVCFTAGTWIRTPAGDRRVEALRPGDLVTTMDNGPQRIRWIGQRRIGPDLLARTPRLLPVRVGPLRGSEGQGLVVSQQHGLLRDADTFVRAGHLALANKGGARLLVGCASVTYLHILFDDHQVIFANGQAAESLYPGPWALRAMDPAAHRELITLWPGIEDGAYGAPARPFLRRKALFG